MNTPLAKLTDLQRQVMAQLTIKSAALSFPLQFLYLQDGPIVTQYYFKAIGSSPLSKILNRSVDLAFAIGRESVLVSVELDKICISVPHPQSERKIIRYDQCLNWIMTNRDPIASQYKLPILMGQTPEGENLCLNLSTQPHVLIAGSTGSGKSIFLSQLIASLTIKISPSKLQFILVDTKQLDLTLFSSLTHVTKIVDKLDDLYEVMADLLTEVRRRTELMKGMCRNIAEYNQLAIGKPLDYKILVIDELADIIDADKKIAKNEDKDERRTRIATSLKQLAQISRAAGIHIIAATQRPSVQVISGDIKANFPCRISFKLPSGVDSRVILGVDGAERLLGKGDYLYQSAEDSTVKRAHSAFVTTEDIARLIDQHDNIREMYDMMAVPS